MSVARRLSIFLSVSVLLAIPLLADEPFARIVVTPNSVEWQSSVSRDSIVLSISGPNGFLLTREYIGNPMIRLSDLNGAADGIYTYDLRVVPHVDASVKKQLAAARAQNDNAAIQQIRTANGLMSPLYQSGSFAIVGGAVLSPDLKEPGARHAATMSTMTAGASGTTTASRINNPPVKTLDQVVADDEIVQGSLCVGLDCVVNESFGFDTIRLKENNTRIKFEDTSTSSGFPTTDWQLTANDSASGGLNKFSIEDITDSKVPFTVIGNAPTDSVRVDSNGKVGFRTSTPGLDLHINTGDTPAIRFEQNSSGGFTAQTWDIGANEANWFVRDVTGGSRLPLRIRPGAPTSSVDISAAGNVGVGTASPSVKLHVLGSGAQFMTCSNDTNTKWTWIYNGGANDNSAIGWDSSDAMRFGTSTSVAGAAFSEKMRITASGQIGIGVTAPTNPIQHSNGAFLSAGGIWTDASSRALKQDISDLNSGEAMEALQALNPVKFAYKVNPKEHHVGFIAEDVPDLVAATNRKGLSPMDIVAVLAKVVKDQQKTIDELSKKVDQLQNK